LISNQLNQIKWYTDSEAIQKGEPGICHSFMACLATTMFHLNGELDPAWMMGASGFAFRIFANKVMCPSAMSVFDFSSILPQSVEQNGYHCNYISRYWGEAHIEKNKQQEAHIEIVKAIDRNVPAIVWDIANVEWGLIIGYDEEKQIYDTLTNEGESHPLPYENLGHNGINILSVTIPDQKNRRTREEIIHNSLKTAIVHAEQKETFERSDYQDGLPAFDLWATLFDHWALLFEAGKEKNISREIPNRAKYYAAHHYSARCYARDYLKQISDKDEYLKKAATAYIHVASFLKPIWDCFSKKENLNAEFLRSLADHIRQAKTAEEEGLDFLKKYITLSS
jgi:hypothetical protein